MEYWNGIGKPEALKYRKGFSRRIDETNRLVYAIDEKWSFMDNFLQRTLLKLFFVD